MILIRCRCGSVIGTIESETRGVTSGTCVTCAFQESSDEGFKLVKEITRREGMTRVEKLTPQGKG